jgi:hypothetical protein
MAKVVKAIAVGAWFTFVSIMIIRGALDDIRQDQETLSYVKTQGTITQASFMEADVDDRRSWGCQYEVMLRYEYEIGGRRFSSAKVERAKDVVCSSDATLNTVLDRYRVGKHVTVFYAPSNPEFAILEPGVQTSPYVGIAFIGILDASLLVALCWCIRQMHA